MRVQESISNLADTNRNSNTNNFDVSVSGKSSRVFWCRLCCKIKWMSSAHPYLKFGRPYDLVTHAYRKHNIRLKYNNVTNKFELKN